MVMGLLDMREWFNTSDRLMYIYVHIWCGKLGGRAGLEIRFSLTENGQIGLKCK